MNKAGLGIMIFWNRLFCTHYLFKTNKFRLNTLSEYFEGLYFATMLSPEFLVMLLPVNDAFGT